MHFSRKKSQRVARSVLVADVYAFAEAYDYTYKLRVDLERILKRKVPLTMLTDSKSLFEVITECSHTAEKRLMIDITSVRDANNMEELSNVYCFRTAHTLTDAFTKVEKCHALETILKTGSCSLPIKQWVIRTKSEGRSHVTVFQPEDVEL